MNKLIPYINPYKDIREVERTLENAPWIYTGHLKSKGISEDIIKISTCDGTIIYISRAEEYSLPAPIREFFDKFGTVFEIVDNKNRGTLYIDMKDFELKIKQRISDLFSGERINILNNIRLPGSECGSFICDNCDRTIGINEIIYQSHKTFDCCLCDRCGRKSGGEFTKGYNTTYGGCNKCKKPLIKSRYIYPSLNFDICSECYHSYNTYKYEDEKKEPIIIRKSQLIKVHKEDEPPQYFESFGSILDWFVFIRYHDIESRFLINCNNDSPYYGMVAQCWTDSIGCEAYDIICKSFPEFINLLNIWLEFSEDNKEYDNFGLWIRNLKGLSVFILQHPEGERAGQI
jgi:hypothetical protein